MKASNRQKCSHWIKQGLWGILPVYGENGENGSLVLLKDTPPLQDKRKVKSVLSEVAALYQKDFSLIRQSTIELTGQKNMNPVPITPQLILMPFKMRRPIGKDDGTVGYLSECVVDSFQGSEKGTSLTLKDGTSLVVLDSLATVQRRIRTSGELSRRLMHSSFDQVQPSCMVTELIETYNLPATKGDLFIIFQRLVDLLRQQLPK